MKMRSVLAVALLATILPMGSADGAHRSVSERINHHVSTATMKLLFSGPPSIPGMTYVGTEMIDGVLYWHYVALDGSEHRYLRAT